MDRSKRRYLNRKKSRRGRHHRDGCLGKDCSYCSGNRLHARRKRELEAEEEYKLYLEGGMDG